MENIEPRAKSQESRTKNQEPRTKNNNGVLIAKKAKEQKSTAEC